MTSAGAGDVATRGSSGSRASDDARRTAAHVHLRGSSFLLVGRGVSLLATLAIQVIVVRYLSKEEYGAFAYAFSIATLAAGLTTAGLDRAVPRFVPIYDEANDHGRLIGTILVALCTILGLGLVLVLGVVALQGWLAGTGIAEAQAVALLAILIALAPLQAIDDLQTALLAVVSTPRAIFLRRYVLTPGLRVLVVLLLAASGGDARFLAVGYVVAAAIGVAIYGVFLWRLLSDRGFIRRALDSGIRFPFRAVFGFALPLLSTDLLYLVLGASDVVVLGYFRGPVAVADLRAVQPLAARLFARQDAEGAREAYWQSAVWIATLSFPIFAATSALAGPLTVTLFGSDYAESAVILAVLATGYYANAALGFNGLTLKIQGHIRLAVAIDLIAGVINVAAVLALVPALGAVGAALGTATTLVVHNVLKQIALRRATGIALFDVRSGALYGGIVAVSALLWIVVALVQPSLSIGIGLVLVATAAVFALGRKRLDVGQVFPELRSVPVLGRLL